MAKFKPFLNQVVIQPEGADEDKNKLVVLAETEDRDPYVEGTVISAGPDCKPPLRGGERVIYNRHAAVKAPFAGQGLVLVKDAQLVGQLNK